MGLLMLRRMGIADICTMGVNFEHDGDDQRGTSRGRGQCIHSVWRAIKRSPTQKLRAECKQAFIKVFSFTHKAYE